MSVVKGRPTVDDDLFEIWSYVADDSIREADKLIWEVSEVFQLLADNPRMGSRREKLAGSLRAFPICSWSAGVLQVGYSASIEGNPIRLHRHSGACRSIGSMSVPDVSSFQASETAVRL